jgi:hypothetical protein
LPFCALSNDHEAAVRPLLPLPLVPAKDRRIFCPKCSRPLLQGEVEVINTPSNSGKGQKISRCPKCRIAVWSNYAGGGDAICFIRVGTLDEPNRLPPDIHIYTVSKQPWVVLPPGVPAVPEFYRPSEQWPKESRERYAALMARCQGQ